jgi:serine/threonine-protein kinase
MTTPRERQPAAEPGARHTGEHLKGARGPAAFDDASWVGRVVDDRYRIEKLLGEGGMGAVFLAEHLKLQKKVALKVILPQFAGDGEIAERFAREAMASARLDHPHVASALDYGVLPDGGAYLVMQFVRGKSLRATMTSRARDVGFACEVGAQIADALTAAHAAGIVHRDLKPDNVVLEPKEGGGELVRVLDFGIARVVGDGDVTQDTKKQLTRVGTIIGTPGYMAPEQAVGEAVDLRADLYALGVILWELLAGRTLFPEEDLTAIVTKQLTSAAPPLPDEVPPELRELVARLLERERSLRPQKAGEVREVLRRFVLASEVERLSTSSATLPALTSGAYAAVRPTGAAPPQAGLPIQLVGLLALMFLGLGGVVLTGTIAVVSAPPTESAAGPAPGPLAPAWTPSRSRRSEPAPAPTPSAPRPEVETPSAALGRDFDTVSTSTDADERRAAAERILASGDSSEPVARLVAEAELASRCRERRGHVEGLGELGDPRARPFLDRLDELPRRGCGFLNSQDCWRCLRRDLTTARRALGAE